MEHVSQNEKIKNNDGQKKKKKKTVMIVVNFIESQDDKNIQKQLFGGVL